MNALDKPQKPRTSVEEFSRLLHDHHPFAAIIKADIVDIGYGSATLLLVPSAGFERSGGMIAGPMLMGLADLALYAAVMGATGNPNAVTATLSINFLRKTPPGGVKAIATLHKTGRLCAGEVVLEPANGGEPVAHAISTWSIPRAS